jgi:hypothetical protein
MVLVQLIMLLIQLSMVILILLVVAVVILLIILRTCKYNIPRITPAFHFVMRPNAAFEINTASICTVAYLVIRPNASKANIALITPYTLHNIRG